MKKKQNLWIILGAIVLIGLMVGAAFLWKGLSADPQEGSKAIVFEVVDKEGASKKYDISTDAEYLADALAEEGLVEYAADGMYNTIDGITADWSVDESWWCITKDGEMTSVGINQQVIADGEHYEATYTIGY
jgi:hypothetical protein